MSHKDSQLIDEDKAAEVLQAADQRKVVNRAEEINRAYVGRHRVIVNVVAKPLDVSKLAFSQQLNIKKES